MEVLTAVHKHPISNTNVAACAGILLPICRYMHTVWTVKSSSIKIALIPLSLWRRQFWDRVCYSTKYIDQLLPIIDHLLTNSLVLTLAKGFLCCERIMLTFSVQPVMAYLVSTSPCQPSYRMNDPVVKLDQSSMWPE